MAVTEPIDSQLWQPRRQLTLAAARRHSAMIGAMRMVSIVAAGAVLALVAGYLIGASFGNRSLTGIEVSGEAIRMVNPRFSGRDNDGTPYQITAADAVRDTDLPDLVTLSLPRLQFQGELNDGSLVLADQGVFNELDNTIELSGSVAYEVQMRPDERPYRFDTTHARVFLGSGRIEGDEPVSGAGPIGELSADRYIIDESGDRVEFIGNFRARIDQAPRLAGPVIDDPFEEAGE